MKAVWTLVLVLACTRAHAETEAAPKKPEAQPPLVCVTEPATGSHIRKRTCMTEEQHAERRKRDQEAMAKMKGQSKALDASSR